MQENILQNINSTKELKTLNYKEKAKLAQEIRELILNTVSKTGGHLASNLGVVELTIALHSIFDVPKDKIIWDVGHQTYVHKILTGRKDKLNTLRQLNGIAGFPKTDESECDCFNTGHSSTSISVALGMARSRDVKKEDNNVIAVIGDGALTGGMALEALNDAGSSNTNLIVILNDNEMSISKNVGGISMCLTKLRTKKFYTKSNNVFKKLAEKTPLIGNFIIKSVRKLKHSIKQLMITNMFFEDIGFTYLGPVDGHDIEKLEQLIKTAKTLEGPVLVHVVTKKGKGYEPAEKEPDKFHSTGSFDINNINQNSNNKKDYSKVFGNKLIELAKKDDRVIAITAAMKDGTGLTQFSKEFPNRFFDVGIAEQHALGLSAGMAKDGLKPFVSIYSSFYQRAYDQVIHDIALQNLPVTLCIDRAGIVGNDGETHHGVFDLSFLNVVPNLNIFAPKDFYELEQILEFSLNFNKPLVIRYPKGVQEKFGTYTPINLGKAEILKKGNDFSIIAIGKMVKKAYDIAEQLKQEEIDAEVINVRFLNPLDKTTILESINKTKNIIVIEDNIIEGGLCTLIKELINDNNLKNIKAKYYAYPKKFIQHGAIEQIEKLYKLDTDSIKEYCKLQKLTKHYVKVKI